MLNVPSLKWKTHGYPSINCEYVKICVFMSNLKHPSKVLNLLALTARGQALLRTWKGSRLPGLFYREDRGGVLRR